MKFNELIKLVFIINTSLVLLVTIIECSSKCNGDNDIECHEKEKYNKGMC
jgi:hypothetical protein